MHDSYAVGISSGFHGAEHHNPDLVGGGLSCFSCGFWKPSPVVPKPLNIKERCGQPLPYTPTVAKMRNAEKRLRAFVAKWYSDLERMYEEGFPDNKVRMWLLKKDPTTPETKSIKKYFAIVSAEREGV
jgi:hypothetical protein